jgi:superfamily II DNA or RNA helicase
MNRDERQDLSVDRVARAGGIGTIEGCTGYGKTNCGKKLYKRVLKKIPNASLLVVVPTTTLKNQWTGILKAENYANFRVETIQAITVAKNMSTLERMVDVVILDEIHLMIDGEMFGQIFDVLIYKVLLGLSGTLTASQALSLEVKCPIVDTIPIEEALKNGWVAQFIEYNLYVELSREEMDEYKEVDHNFKLIYPIFNSFLKIIDCQSTEDRIDPKRGAIIGAETQGKRIMSRLILAGADLDVRFDHVKAWFVDDHGEWLTGTRLTTKVKDLALQANALSKRRKSILFDSDTCIDTAVEVVESLNMKTVTFGESIYAANMMAEKLGERALPYHSKVLSQVRVKRKEKAYVREASAIKFYELNLCKLDNLVIEGKKVSWDHSYKVGKKTIREETLIKLENNEIDRVTSAKGLDVGLDVTGMQLGVNLPSDAKKEKYNQRRGRLIRKELLVKKDKVGIIVNIVPLKTKAVEWIERAQYGNTKIRHIHNVSDIIVDNPKYTNNG